MRRKHEDFHDGAKDGLTPLEPLDITSVQDFDELLAAMGKTAFGGRNLGEAAEVLTQMVRDPECAMVGTFSGAMSVAKMGLLICEMIDRGWLKVVITTGALIAHGFIETLGRAHYKYPEQVSDRQLFQQGYNRIYDTLEMEANLDYAEDVFSAVLEGLDPDQVWSSASLCRELGKYLAEHSEQPRAFCVPPILKGCRCLSRPSPTPNWVWTWRASWCGGPWPRVRTSILPWGQFP